MIRADVLTVVILGIAVGATQGENAKRLYAIGAREVAHLRFRLLLGVDGLSQYNA